MFGFSSFASLPFVGLPVSTSVAVQCGGSCTVDWYTNGAVTYVWPVPFPTDPTGVLGTNVSFDYSNQSQFQLIVDGVTVDFSTSYFNMGDYSVTYDGKQLTFSEIATPYPARCTFRDLAPVTATILYTPYGSTIGSQYVFFTGSIYGRKHVGINNQEAIEYTVKGTQRIAYDMQLLETDILGNTLPYVRYPVERISSVTSYDQGVPTFTLQVSNAPNSQIIRDFFTVMAPQLSAAGIPSTFGDPGPDTLQSYCPQDLIFRNMTFGEAIKKILELEPARKVFYDDLLGKWIFPSVTAGPIAQIPVNTANILENVYQEDLDGRYTAYRLISQFSYPTKAKRTDLCAPNWDATLELDWTVEKAIGVTDPGTFNENYQWVYRRWSLPNSRGNRRPETPDRAYAEIDFGDNFQYVPVDAYIDYESGNLVTNVPVVIGGNPHGLDAVDDGHGNIIYRSSAIGPSAMYLTTWADTTIPEYLVARWPPTGYQGTAYSVAGLQREKFELCDLGNCTLFNAAAKLETVQDILISGEIPIDGDMILPLSNLFYRIRLTHPTKDTGLSTLSAYFTSYKYSFGKRGKQSLGLTTDRVSFVKVW